MEEVWKDIKGYEGFYQVSNMGRAKSLERVIARRDGTHQHVTEKILTPFKTGGPPFYLAVRFRKNGVKATKKLHRMVAEAFVPNPHGLNVVDHIDCNAHNNEASNLRWCTIADNNRFCREAGRTNPRHYGDWDIESKMSYRAKRCKPFIRSDGKVYMCLADAAEDLCVRKTSIHKVLRGQTRTCKGYTFKYVTNESSPSGLFS